VAAVRTGLAGERWLTIDKTSHPHVSSGYRHLSCLFLHAPDGACLGACRRPDALDDPLRAQSLSLISGVILAVIVGVVCAVLAFLRPSGALGSAPIVMMRDSGGPLCPRRRHHSSGNQPRVRTNDRRHARRNPEPVSASAINNAKRAPLMGIPGAPPSDSRHRSAGTSQAGWSAMM